MHERYLAEHPGDRIITQEVVITAGEGKSYSGKEIDRAVALQIAADANEPPPLDLT